jgi:transcriptional regulator with XRE-family HTH domain
MRNSKTSEIIKKYRKLSDLTQKDMAKVLGISRSNYGNKESGRIAFSHKEIIKAMKTIKEKNPDLTDLQIYAEFFREIAGDTLQKIDNTKGEKMDIFKYRIVKQSNGKFALWDDENKSFDFINSNSPEEIKDSIVKKTDIILTESIISLAQDDAWFKSCVEEYKVLHGLDDSEKRAAVEELRAMGESVEGF